MAGALGDIHKWAVWLLEPYGPVLMCSVCGSYLLLLITCSVHVAVCMLHVNHEFLDVLCLAVPCQVQVGTCLSTCQSM